nr:MAG TPA_asm: hypothetical protein [Bacteriophage sp.]
MKLNKELQEVLAVVLIDEQLGDLIDDWGITRYLPTEELKKKNEEFYLCLVQYKELLNQWAEKNLVREETDGNKEKDKAIN